MTDTVGTHPARLDLTVHAGEPVDVSISVLDALGVPVPNLTGYTAAAQARAGDGPDAALLHTFAVTFDVGAVRVQADGDATAAWTFLSAPWDLVLTAPGGSRSVLVAGWVRRYPTITH